MSNVVTDDVTRSGSPFRFCHLRWVESWSTVDSISNGRLDFLTIRKHLTATVVFPTGAVGLLVFARFLRARSATTSRGNSRVEPDPALNSALGTREKL